MSRILQPFLTNLIKNFETSSREMSSKKPSKKGKKKSIAPKVIPAKPSYRSRKLEKLDCHLKHTCPVNIARDSICPETGKRPRLSFRKDDPNEISITGPGGKKLKGMKKPCPPSDWENK